MDLSDCYGRSGGAEFSELFARLHAEYGDDGPFERDRFLDSDRPSIYDQLESRLTQVLICPHVPNRSSDRVWASCAMLRQIVSSGNEIPPPEFVIALSLS
jgi:hypothetical protein